MQFCRVELLRYRYSVTIGKMFLMCFDAEVKGGICQWSTFDFSLGSRTFQYHFVILCMLK